MAFTNAYAQTDADLFKAFNYAVKNNNAKEGIDLYPKVKSLFDSKYSPGDTLELDYRFHMFFFAKNNNQINLAAHELQRLEFLIDKNYLKTTQYADLMYNLYTFQRDQKNYSECKRILLKTMDDQRNQKISESQELAILYSDLAFINGRLGETDDEIIHYQKAIPLAEKYLTVQHVIDDKYLLANALYDKHRFSEFVIIGKECDEYFKKTNQEKNKLSESINLYQLAVANDSLGNKEELINYANEFLNIISRHPEFGLDLYVILITTRLNQLKQDEIEFVVNIWENYLSYFIERLKLNPKREDYSKNIVEAYYRVSLYSMSFIDEENYEIQKRYNTQNAILKSRMGLKFCRDYNLESTDFYFLLQDKLVEALNEIKSPDAIDEINYARKIVKKYFSGDLLKNITIDVREAEYLLINSNKNKALKLFLNAEKSMLKIENKDFDFLSLQYVIFSGLAHIYTDLGDIQTSQKYQYLQTQNQNLSTKSMQDFGNKYNIEIDNEYSAYSDSLTDFGYLIIQKCQDNSAVDISLSQAYEKLSRDLNRQDLNSVDKLEILQYLGYICLKTENYVQRKKYLQQEQFIRDSLGLWSDSLRISFTISFAHIENELYETDLAISILEKAISDFGEEKIIQFDDLNTTLLNNLAHYYSNSGNVVKAGEILQKELIRLDSLSNRYSGKGPQELTQDRLTILNNLGELCLAIDDVRSAYNYLHRAYILAKDNYSKTSITYYNALQNYSDILMFSEKKDEAEQLLIEENKLAEMLFSKADFEFFNSQKQLFLFYYLDKNYSLCDKLYSTLSENFLNCFFENGKGLNKKQFIQYQIKLWKEFSMFFEYAVKRYDSDPQFLEGVINLYFIMTELMDERELSIKNDNLIYPQLLKTKNEYQKNAQLPFEDLNSLLKSNKLKNQIDSLENEYFVNINNKRYLNEKRFSEFKSNLPVESAFVFNILHHELNTTKISIKENTSMFKEGATINYIFVVKRNEDIQFDRYDDLNFNAESINADYTSLTRSVDQNYDFKSTLISNIFSSTVEKLKDVQTLFVYPTDFLSWFNLEVLKAKTSEYEVENFEVTFLSYLGTNMTNKDIFTPKKITLFGAPEFSAIIEYHKEIKDNGIIGVSFDFDKLNSSKEVIISKVNPNSPAEKADIRVGDRVISVDNILLDTLKSLFSVYNLITGEVGSEVNIQILRSGLKLIKKVVRVDKTLDYKSNYTQLPGTLKEITTISKELSSHPNIIINPFIGINATEENLKNNLNTDILHIATHSFFINRELQIKKYDLTPFNGVYTNSYYGNQYFDNGLVFAGVNNFKLDYYNGSHDNGFLYAGEIENLNMSNVKLVVLSSCESGLANESLFQTTRGIINSLEKAGVQNAIVSLWKVDDKVTQEFMVQFYKNLFSETSISSALRKTKLDIKKQHPEPYYWAPFVLYQLN